MSLQSKHIRLNEIITTPLTNEGDIWRAGTGGYWSMLDKDTMAAFQNDLGTMSPQDVVRKHFPDLEDLIFSPRRTGGIGMLDISPDDVVVDAGCMWGALTVPLARTGATVIGLDQTIHSLNLLRARLDEEGLDNAHVVQTDLNQIEFEPNSVDVLVLNGVMEWLAEGDIEAQKMWDTHAYDTDAKQMRSTPRDVQLRFLKTVCAALKPGGHIYLAIENRYDVANFFGARDPHTGQRGVTVLPRGLQDKLARAITGRSYRAWIYGQDQLTGLLLEAGFSSSTTHYVFPDYRYPDLILSKDGMSQFRPVRYLKAGRFITKLYWYVLETVFYKILKCGALAPSFVVIGRK